VYAASYNVQALSYKVQAAMYKLPTIMYKVYINVAQKYFLITSITTKAQGKGEIYVVCLDTDIKVSGDREFHDLSGLHIIIYVVRYNFRRKVLYAFC